MIGFDQLLRLLHTHFRLGLIVGVNHFDRQAAELAPMMVEPKLKRIFHVVADRSRRTGKGRNETDLHRFLLAHRRPGGERQHGARGNTHFSHLAPPLVGDGRCVKAYQSTHGAPIR